MKRVALILSLFILGEYSQVSSICLESFKELPQELDGCGCYFYLSKKDEKGNKYIFVNDFASTEFVFVNNRLEKFELKEHDEGSNLYSYSNEEYDLKIERTESLQVETKLLMLKASLR